MSETIIIKKYANRRLYNTATSTYVTLETVAGLVRDGVDFIVEDARTGDDITRQILTQIIVESESAGDGLLPVGFLRDLIRQYSGGVGGVLPDYLDMSMKTFTEAKDQWTKALTGAGSPQMVSDMFKSAMDRNLAIMGEAARSFQEMVPGAAGLEAFWPKPAATSRTGADPQTRASRPDPELEALKAQMAAMQEQIEKLAGRNRPD
jgi:polyhydroxyalkanoate synthesis repressor PhaR